MIFEYENCNNSTTRKKIFQKSVNAHRINAKIIIIFVKKRREKNAQHTVANETERNGRISHTKEKKLEISLANVMRQLFYYI
jgi:hypothetical protein